MGLVLVSSALAANSEYSPARWGACGQGGRFLVFVPTLQRAGAMERWEKHPRDEPRWKRALMEVGRMGYEHHIPNPMKGGVPSRFAKKDCKDGVLRLVEQ